MSSGYRLLILALGLILIGAHPPSDDRSQPTKPPSDKIEQALEDMASSLREANKPSHLNQPCKDGDDDRASDLCAQWKAADAADSAAEATWLFGSLGSLIGAFTLAAAWSAAKWAKSAAEATSDAVRPWVTGEIELASGIYRDEHGRAVIHFRGSATNSGTSPACNVRLHICVTDKIDPDWGAQFKNSRGGTHSVLRPGGCLKEGLIAPVFGDESVEEPSAIYLRISIIYHRVGKPDILYFEEHYRVHAAIPGPMTGGWFKPSGIGNEPIPVILLPVAQSSIIT